MLFRSVAFAGTWGVGEAAIAYFIQGRTIVEARKRLGSRRAPAGTPEPPAGPNMPETPEPPNAAETPETPAGLPARSPDDSAG